MHRNTFMYAAGIDSNDTEEASLVCLEFAASLFERIDEFNQHCKFKYTLRSGMHIGPVVSGVIGRSMPLYDILGMTANKASRIETSGLNGFIQVK